LPSLLPDAEKNESMVFYRFFIEAMNSSMGTAAMLVVVWPFSDVCGILRAENSALTYHWISESARSRQVS
jgi:hypothetical protein